MENSPLSESEKNTNEKEPKPVSFETERGSVYSYDEQGKVTRFKKATGETLEKSDVVAFIPHWGWIEQYAPKEFLDKLQNELILKQEMLRYIHTDNKDLKIYLVDEKGNKIDSQEDLEKAIQPFLYFGTVDKEDFSIPVSKVPKIDYTPYDSLKYEENGQPVRYRHIGHKITKINYEK